MADQPCIGRGGEPDDLAAAIGAKRAGGHDRRAPPRLRDREADRLGALGGDLQDLADRERLQRGKAHGLAVQHGVDRHRRRGGGAAHQRLPQVVGPVARRGVRLRVERGADHVERRERQHEIGRAAPPGLGHDQGQAEHQHVDVVGAEAHLADALAQVAQAQRLGRLLAEGATERRDEGVQRRLEIEPAEAHVDRGQAAVARIRHVRRIAAERQVDQVLGKFVVEGDQARVVGPSISMSPISAGAVIGRTASASRVTRGAAISAASMVLTSGRSRSSIPRA
jgi:hypothetical protein